MIPIMVSPMAPLQTSLKRQIDLCLRQQTGVQASEQRHFAGCDHSRSPKDEKPVLDSEKFEDVFCILARITEIEELFQPFYFDRTRAEKGSYEVCVFVFSFLKPEKMDFGHLINRLFESLYQRHSCQFSFKM